MHIGQDLWLVSGLMNLNQNLDESLNHTNILQSYIQAIKTLKITWCAYHCFYEDSLSIS